MVGEASFNVNENFKFNYQFALDQNYQDLNYNDFGTNITFGNMGIDFNYIEEDRHIGNQEYFKTKINYKNGKIAYFHLKLSVT